MLQGFDDGAPALEVARRYGNLSGHHRLLSDDDLVIVLDDRALNGVPDDDAWRSLADARAGGFAGSFLG
ncbi:hypothetical protein E1212_17305 [Jiangella ureilytica]|uniref:Uncharacterized protein n=1 Tax=Jiangella ureilytica TaxID=2530374 RepID=A0A4R4RM39_9ACTN|nr:hypothetical protein [Jiangella ureilytica]TDC49722.1 hypothetical protein E1212_17305 [Jiangella ureilytica]